MTEWLDDVLDQHPGAPVPEGFAERVMHAVAEEQAPPKAGGHLLRLASFAAAAALLLAVGFWMGHGADPMRTPTNGNVGAETAELDVTELYNNRELLEDFELLSDAGLELVFQDESTGTFMLDVPLEDTSAED